tara:strand:- start:9351 stop:10616 length:1266 start_codon:yes stop_codon:yes gene_type:complete
MRKVLIIFFVNILFFNTSFAEKYYFKRCQLTDILFADYYLDLKNNIINVKLEAIDGTVQEFSDPIKLIEKDKIISKKIESGKSKDAFFVYYLDVKTKAVIKQNYKKEKGIGLIRPDGPKRISYCKDIKANWNVGKIELAEEEKEQEQMQKIQEEMLKEEISATKCKGNDKNQWSSCVGTLTTENGFVYIGEFKNGNIVKGTALYPGNAKYVGQFENNKPHGQGTFTFSDGSKYYGDWINGKGNGNGTKTWKDGRKYSGKFVNDEPHGKGTFLYANGSKYVGEWSNGKRHGEGTLTYSDGTAYVGQFVDGQEHGRGTCFNKDGSNISCEKDMSSSGRNTHNISVNRDKWIKISEFEGGVGKAKKTIEFLEKEFDQKASEHCSVSGNFKILKKRINIIETDETPAIGLETVIKLGINGVVECN